ncbi:MAG: polyprenyl synthetase family protein [Candidatus Caldatribacteriaceae bacterium]
MSVEEFLKGNALEIDEFLKSSLPSQGVPPRLLEAMRYGVIGGGKKLRASLLFATAEAYGVEKKNLLPLAAGIEMIHAFSLIHDDLPCMDNDDFRRGKPSMHRAFGEAMGVLVGDALLVEGLAMFASNAHFVRCFGTRKTLQVAQVILSALGSQGMVGGQVLDLEYQGGKVTEREVEEIYLRKTARFIQAPIICGGILGEGTPKEQKTLEEFGIQLGKCFQIKDDLLDVTQESKILGKTAKKDIIQDKATLVKIKGIEDAEKILQKEWDRAVTLLCSLERPFGKLLELARFVVERAY